jgi:hypothetical protein
MCWFCHQTSGTSTGTSQVAHYTNQILTFIHCGPLDDVTRCHRPGQQVQQSKLLVVENVTSQNIATQTCPLHRPTCARRCTVHVFRQEFTLGDTNGSHTPVRLKRRRVPNGILLRCTFSYRFTM